MMVDLCEENDSITSEVLASGSWRNFGEILAVVVNLHGEAPHTQFFHFRVASQIL
jgi:hypothetical protein